MISLTNFFSSSNSTIIPLFEKVLSASDAGRIGRLVLPKACAEVCFQLSHLFHPPHFYTSFSTDFFAHQSRGLVFLYLCPRGDTSKFIKFNYFHCSGIFPTNFSTRRPSSADSRCEGQRMGIPVQILAKQQQQDVCSRGCDPLHTIYAITSRRYR